MSICLYFMQLSPCIFVGFSVYKSSLELVKNLTLSETWDWSTRSSELQHPQVDMWGASEEFQKLVATVVTH